MIPRRAPCRGEGGLRGTGAPQGCSQVLVAAIFGHVAGGRAPSVPTVLIPKPGRAAGGLQAQWASLPVRRTGR